MTPTTSSWAVVALALFGCASPAPATPTAAATADPSAKARAESCANAATEATHQPPKEAMRVVVQGCLSVYREQGCREAQLQAIDDATDPSQRSRIITEGCAKAYCDKLPQRHPFCDLDWNADITTSLRLGADLMHRIQAFELGDDEVNVVADAFARAEAERKQAEPAGR